MTKIDPSPPGWHDEYECYNFTVYKPMTLIPWEDSHHGSILKENMARPLDSVMQIAKNDGVECTLQPLVPAQGKRPARTDYRMLPEKWMFKCEHGPWVPEWFSPAFAEAEGRRLLPAWIKAHVIKDKKGVVVKPGTMRVMIDCETEQIGGEAWLYSGTFKQIPDERGCFGGIYFAHEDCVVLDSRTNWNRAFKDAKIHLQAGSIFIVEGGVTVYHYAPYEGQIIFRLPELVRETEILRQDEKGEWRSWQPPE